MAMTYRRLGKSGLQVSALSYGAWVTFSRQLTEHTARDCMVAAYEAGCNFFDNAEGYEQGQAEVQMGAVLAEVKWPRESYLVSSKVFFGAERRGPNMVGLSRKHVIEACHAALRRLRVDYLDLYFCHRPDPHTPVEETVRAMNTLIEQGKVLYWGTSEWSARDIQEAMGLADTLGLIGPTMEQPQYNLLHRHRVEIEYAPLYESRTGLGTTIWSPLASGFLTGKYLDGIGDQSRLGLPGYEWLRSRFEGDAAAAAVAKVRRLKALADDLGLPLARLALAWVLKNPRVSTAITGASRVEQVRDNMRAAEALPLLTDEVMARLDDIVGRPAAEEN